MKKTNKINIKSSSQTFIEDKNPSIIYGSVIKEEDKTLYFRDFINLNEEIKSIKTFIEKNKPQEIEIYDINNSIASIIVCTELNLKYKLIVSYPNNYMSKFAKLFFNIYGVEEGKIFYNDPNYEEEYNKIFAKCIKNYNQFTKEDIKILAAIKEDYESYENTNVINLKKIVEFDNQCKYLNFELHRIKTSKLFKITEKIRKNKIISKIVKIINILSFIANYRKKYGFVRLFKKIYYKFAKIKDIPLWETEGKVDLNSNYSYKFYKYKKERNKNNSFEINKCKMDFVKNKVSIILPVYNGEDTVAESIESVLNQTYKNFEFIIVNDGSKDNTLKILKKYAKKDKRIKIIDQENGKLPKALNNGFKEATGEFFTWTSADNNMHPEYIERMVRQLKQDKTVAMIYADMQLIDENGEILKNYGWYEIPENSGNVILPSDISMLNTYPNNYIGAAFMYRNIVQKLIPNYSENRYTVEDYDYWLRINSLLNIKKARLSEPLYYYRFHSKSLTSQSKELKINEKRDEMMVYDDFRRDYYLTPFFWIIDIEDNKSLSSKIKELIKNKNQIIISNNQINNNYTSDKYNNIIYITNKKGNLDDTNRFNVYINSSSLGKIELNINKTQIKTTINNAIDLIDIAANEYYTSKFENYIYNFNNATEKYLSVIICTYKRSEQLMTSIKNAINQTENKDNYEILIVNNDPLNKEIFNIVENFRKKYKLSNNFLRYVDAPQKGLSYARNVGMWESKGEKLIYLDDDSLADSNLVEIIKDAFKNNKDAGVIGGNIILDVPNPTPKIYNKKYSELWSEFKIEKEEKYYEAKEWFEYPYGANFSVDKEALLKIGGFRISYGRVGNNFAGGEEIAVSALMQQLNKKILLVPAAKVKHAVDVSRYTEEHIKKTYINGAHTRYKLFKDLYIKEPMYEEDILYIINNIKNKKVKSENEEIYRMAEQTAYEKLLEYYKEEQRIINKENV